MTAGTLRPTVPAAGRPAPRVRGRGRSARADLALAWWQTVDEQRSFWRNRSRAFFSFALPLLFLVVFTTLNSGEVLADRGGISANTLVVPGLLAYGVIMATFTNVAVQLAVLREAGVLKRLRGTPLPDGAFIAGQMASAVVVALAVAGATLAIGALAYGVDLRAATLPGLVATLAAGTACFTALGIAVLRLIGRADSAAVVTNACILPLTFISDVWGDFGAMPGWLETVAAIFPVKHLAHALQITFDPRTAGPGIVAGDLLALAAWTAGGALLACAVLRRERRRG